MSLIEHSSIISIINPTDSTPAAMDFVEARMLHHLEAQDVAKTEQSERVNRNPIDPATSSRRIDVGAKEDEPSRKLLLPWIGPYKVIWHDATRTTYQLDLGSERAHSYFFAY
jgi:hypothetical protein